MSEDSGHSCGHDHAHGETCGEAMPADLKKIVDIFAPSILHCANAMIEGGELENLDIELQRDFSLTQELAQAVLSASAETIRLFVEEADKASDIEQLIVHLVEEMKIDEQVSISVAFNIHKRITQLMEQED